MPTLQSFRKILIMDKKCCGHTLSKQILFETSFVKQMPENMFVQDIL